MLALAGLIILALLAVNAMRISMSTMAFFIGLAIIGAIVDQWRKIFK